MTKQTTKFKNQNLDITNHLWQDLEITKAIPSEPFHYKLPSDTLTLQAIKVRTLILLTIKARTLTLQTIKARTLTIKKYQSTMLSNFLLQTTNVLTLALWLGKLATLGP